MAVSSAISSSMACTGTQQTRVSLADAARPQLQLLCCRQAAWEQSACCRSPHLGAEGQHGYISQAKKRGLSQSPAGSELSPGAPSWQGAAAHSWPSPGAPGGPWAEKWRRRALQRGAPPDRHRYCAPRLRRGQMLTGLHAAAAPEAVSAFMGRRCNPSVLLSDIHKLPVA